MNFQLFLGRANADLDAGYLSLYADTPSADLAKPVSLKVPFERPGVEVLTSGGLIKQVKSPQGLVHVSVKDNYEYYLQCFYEPSVAKDGNGDYILDGNGFYTTNAAAYVTWTVKNPDAGTSYNRLYITEQRDSTSRDFKYTNTAASLRWDLGLPDGHTVISTWKEAITPGGATTNYFRQITFDGSVVRKKRSKYEYISALTDTILKEVEEGDSGVTRTTTNTYYSSGAGTGSAYQLQRVDYPEGNWVYYKYDGLGRRTNEFSAIGNNTPPSPGNEPVPLTDNCKLIEYAYSLTSANDGVDDDGSKAPGTVRRQIVKIPSGGAMREVSRSYHHFIYPSSGDDYSSESETCPEPGVQWGATGNLRTQTMKNSDGTVSSVTAPDGITTYYYYYEDNPNAGWRTTVVQHGNTQGTTIVDELGFIQSRTTKDTGTDVTFSGETYNYKDQYNQYLDPLRRSHDVTDLAGRTTQYRFNNCCALDYMIDADGVKTYQVQDPLLRQEIGTRRVVELVSSTERTIQVTNKLDAAGEILATKRVGTNGSVVTLAQFQYDVLGRIVRQTNALDGVTITTNRIVDNRLCVTNINPDGGTSIALYYRDRELQMTAGTAGHGVKYVHGVEQDGSPWREYTKEIKLDASGAETSEWTKTYVDGAGRNYKTVYAAVSTPYPYQQTYYNENGQVSKQRDPDTNVTLYAYNSLGERELVVKDMDQDGVIDDGNASDRVTKTVRSYVAATGGKPDLVRTDTLVWKDGGSAGTLVSRAEVSADGQLSWQTVYPNASTAVVSSNHTVYGTSGYRYMTNAAPGGDKVVSVYHYGQLVSVTRRDSSTPGDIITQTIYGYDAHGRQNTAADARNGITTYTFNNADQVATTTIPPPGNGQPAQATTTLFDSSLRAWKTTQSDGTSVTNEFYPNGLLKRMHGSRVYPVGYGYDYAGRMTKMTNWSTFSTDSGRRVTTWNYNAYRGWLDSKDYPNDSTGEAGTTGPDYTYYDSGRLKERIWVRGNPRVKTTYAYDEAGDLENVDYNDSTLDLNYQYDRLGRQKIITQGSAITTLTRNDAGQLLIEAYSDSSHPLNGLSVTNGFDQFLRRTNLIAINGSSTILNSNIFGYDIASRLQTVTDFTVNNTPYSATYSYVANSPLVGQIVFKQSSTARMTTTKNYDYLNRLSAIVSTPSGAGQPSISYAYQHNEANQRGRVGLADGSFWLYEYDQLGQVRSGKRYWSDWTPVAGQQFEYGHDDIGNRTATKAGGDVAGAGLQSASYTANRLNQYTSRDVPGAVDVMGAALAGATVTVNSQATYRRGEYFRRELNVINSSVALWQSIAVAATGETTVNGNVFVPKDDEVFNYDGDGDSSPDDGNLMQDGRWDYVWDAENRLVKLRSRSGSPAPERRIELQYDHQSRRIRKTVYNDRDDGQGSELSDVLFLYDGWNLLAELDANASNAKVRTYLWGIDLSGSLQGAGGVGGLLEMVYYGAQTTNCFAAYDGNGNLSALVNASDGKAVAQYEYGPFGEALRVSGAMAMFNPYRFSTKLQDDESDLVYYGYRFYNSSLGRWLSRDPIGERGGLSLYGFVKNRPVDLFDPFGLYSYPSDPGGCPPGTGEDPNCNQSNPGYRYKNLATGECPCISTAPPPRPPPPRPPPPRPPEPRPPEPPPSSGSRSFNLETFENGKPCSSVCYCKPTDFYRAGSGQADWDHYQLKDATFSRESCTCNYTVISGPSAGNAYSQKGGFGKICGCHWK